MTYHEELIELADGRTLEVATMGSPSGATIFVHHGTPGSTRTSLSFEGLLARGDFFLVTLSRPGYGQSSRRADRSVASVIEDVGAALAHVGREEYVALGWSGGGPHALASAALDETCRAALTVASVAPADADFDWIEGMGPENLEEFRLAQEGGPAYEDLMAATGDVLGLATKDNIVEIMGGLLSAPDLAAIDEDDARELFVEGMRYGFATGWRGYLDDNVALMAPWGFDVGDITTPVHLFYGDDDLMVPAPHNQWLSTHLPQVTTTHHPEEGHLSIFTRHLDEIATALREL
jgi:pimeloyl-ACP methyl ester carboxylesterase